MDTTTLTELRFLALREVHQESVTYNLDTDRFRHTWDRKPHQPTYRWLLASELVELRRAPWITADAPVALTPAGHRALAAHQAKKEAARAA